MSIYITGDTHGDIDIKKLTSKCFPEGKNLTKEDYVIICGDAAVCWDNKGYDKYIQNWYKEKPWTTLFVDGNHENFDVLESYPIEEWHGGKVHFINDSLIHLMRGQVYEIHGRTFFTMGGAKSQDIQWRKVGVSWWDREIMSEEETEEAEYNLKRYGYNVDYVITHEGPFSVVQGVYSYLIDHNYPLNYLEHLNDYISCKKWFIGHHHKDIAFTDKYRFIYQDVVLLGD